MLLSNHSTVNFKVSQANVIIVQFCLHFEHTIFCYHIEYAADSIIQYETKFVTRPKFCNFYIEVPAIGSSPEGLDYLVLVINLHA